MSKEKRRYKQKRTSYLSTIARDWFLGLIHHSNPEQRPAPFPPTRLPPQPNSVHQSSSKIYITRCSEFNFFLFQIPPTLQSNYRAVGQV